MSDFIQHYGKKGMRWGVRKSSSQVKPRSSDAKNAEKILAKKKNQGIRALSNDDIQAVTRRLQLERQLSQLDPSPTRRTLDTVRSILGAGRTVNDAISFAQSPPGLQLANSLSRNQRNNQES